MAAEGEEPAMAETAGIIPFFPSIMAAQPDEFNATECICSDLQHEDYSPLYAWFNYIVIIIMLPSLSAFGVATNAVNVFVYSRSRMRNSSNTYLLFLACSDFFVVVTGLFIFWIDSARSYIPQLVQAPYTTVYTLPFGYMAQSCSIYFTVAAAFDCYICVCWHSLAKKYCTVRRARRIVGAIVLCSILYNSLRFPQFNLRRCIHEGSKEMIVEICPTTLFFAINTVYNVYLYMIVMTLLPFAVLLVLNLIIICRKSIDASRERRQQKKSTSTIASIPMKSPQSKEAPSLNGVDAHKLNRRASLPKSRRSSDKPAHIAAALLGGTMAHFPPLPKARPGSDETLTMIMVVVLFLCCNTLALIVNLIETFFEPDALLLNLLSDASNFLVIFNSSVNCVIYLIFNNEYREVFLVHFVRTRDYLQRRIFLRAIGEEDNRHRMRNVEDGTSPTLLGNNGDCCRANGLKGEGKWRRTHSSGNKRSAIEESPIWLAHHHHHHHICHCPCKCPLLLRCARLASEERDDVLGDDKDSGCDEGGTGVGGSASNHRHLSSSAGSYSPPRQSRMPASSPSVLCRHPNTFSGCYLAEVKMIVPGDAKNGADDAEGTDQQMEAALSTPPHIYVRPLMRTERRRRNNSEKTEGITPAGQQRQRPNGGGNNLSVTAL